MRKLRIFYLTGIVYLFYNRGFMLEKIFIEEVAQLRTSKEVYDFLLKTGFSVSEKEAAEIFYKIHQQGDLSQDELSNVGQGQRFF